MSDRSLSSAQVLTLLADMPPRIAALTAGLEPAQAHTPPQDDGWSVNDVLAHLRSCADVWGNCMATILAHDRPTLRAVNPTTWIKKTDYCEQAFQASLHAFTTQRAELLAVLQPLTPDEWASAATVTGAGRPLERTVFFYARWLATHERQHLKQIARIVNAMRP